MNNSLRGRRRRAMGMCILSRVGVAYMLGGDNVERVVGSRLHVER